MDLAIALAVLWGMVWYEQWNAFPWFSNPQGTGLDDVLNRITGWPHYPNLLDFVGLTFVVPLFFYLYVRVTTRLFPAVGDWRKAFMAQAYALIPLVGSDYLARQLPKFWDHIVRVPLSLTDPFGWNWRSFQRIPLWNFHILSNAGVVESQVVLTILGTGASLYAAWRIRDRDYPRERGAGAFLASACLVILLAGVYTAWMYIQMAGAE